jgi:hypothetical protein
MNVLTMVQQSHQLTLLQAADLIAETHLMNTNLTALQNRRTLSRAVLQIVYANVICEERAAAEAVKNH